MKKFTSSNYLMNIDDVKFDTVISSFNRLQSQTEYIKTLESIKAIGQTDPILMDNGYCIDGRHRVKALKELDIRSILAVNINPNLSMTEKLLLSNRDLTSGRDLTKTQLAIQAYKYAELTKNTKADVAKQFGINKRMLTYVSEIKQYLPNAYKDLENTGTTTIDGKYTQSLEKVYKYVNAEVKPEAQNEIATTELAIDYNKLIDTEKGKKLFWELYTENHRPDAMLAEHLVHYVNLIYKKIT